MDFLSMQVAGPLARIAITFQTSGSGRERAMVQSVRWWEIVGIGAGFKLLHVPSLAPFSRRKPGAVPAGICEPLAFHLASTWRSPGWPFARFEQLVSARRVIFNELPRKEKSATDADGMLNEPSGDQSG